MNKSCRHPSRSYGCLLFCIAVALFASTPRFAIADDRPNIVMIVVDDLNDWVGCLQGHPQAQTPHIDALASRGMLFANAHCQAPLCNPSRTSVLTGKRPSSTGVYALEPWLRKAPALQDCVTLPEYFKKNGYEVIIGGKLFHGGGPPQEERARYADIWGPESSIGARPRSKLVTTPAGNHPLVDWGTFPHADSEKGDYQLASWVEQELPKRTNQPFFLTVGFFLPHVPCYATQEWFDRYPQSSLILPKVLESDRSDIPEFAWYLHSQLPEPRLSWLRKQEQWKNLVQAYLACVSFMDAQVGRVVAALDQEPYRDNTIIVFWSDHGWHLGEKGVTGKNTLWSESTRVPMIFAGPGIAQGVCQQPVELLDLYPTLAELCRLPVSSELEGHSLVPQLRDQNAERNWPAITTQSQGNHSVVSRDWRYIRYADGSEELYNIRTDPDEWHNLAKQPGVEEVVAAHSKWLPSHNERAAPGSKSRLLELVDGKWHWEGQPINPDAIEK
ncbi:sulfatase [Planctomicrobium sp. SH661]|uniref:sulfatase n=1 Tax=Planctomicrobium sp. SH661 TaxID=3448124 RepID=UPI003F5C519A